MQFNRETNDVEFDFKGKDLVKGETDGSSYPNGGLRGTHCAGGYLAPDTSSPIFLRGDTIFIPSVFVSYYGMALDEKTPLLRANDALSNNGKRLLKCLGLFSNLVEHMWKRPFFQGIKVPPPERHFPGGRSETQKRNTEDPYSASGNAFSRWGNLWDKPCRVG